MKKLLSATTTVVFVWFLVSFLGCIVSFVTLTGFWFCLRSLLSSFVLLAILVSLDIIVDYRNKYISDCQKLIDYFKKEPSMKLAVEIEKLFVNNIMMALIGSEKSNYFKTVVQDKVIPWLEKHMEDVASGAEKPDRYNIRECIDQLKNIK